MEDEIQKQINELFDRLHELANSDSPFDDWLSCDHQVAGLIIENDRRRIEEIEMLRGAIEGWRRTNEEQREKIASLIKRKGKIAMRLAKVERVIEEEDGWTTL